MADGSSTSGPWGVQRILPERRIYIRTDARTRYLALGPFSQLGAAALLSGLVGWTGFTTTSYVSRAMDASRAEMRLETTRNAYEARLAAIAEEQAFLETELNAAHERNTAVTDRLAEKQRHLVEVASTFKHTELELKSLRAAHIALVEDLRQARKDTVAIEREMAALQFDLAQAHNDRSGVTSAMSVFTNTIDQVIVERDIVAARSAHLDGQVQALRDEITEWETHQERVLTQLESAARTSLSSLTKVFERSNIDLDRVLSETKRDYSGKGGLFEPIDDLPGDRVEDGERVAALMNDLEQVNLMRLAADRLPFGQPVKAARRTSGFGIRRDPFRGRSSMHSGVDWAAPRGTPIFSTAHGVVTYSGRLSGYGIVVKIKHAFGFETLYAHLNRSRVKVGQRVERGDRIADMGSTGRSTGSHLHYEIRIEKEPVNPAKFIEAARDVL